jgi:hypothetical protein
MIVVVTGPLDESGAIRGATLVYIQALVTIPAYQPEVTVVHVVSAPLLIGVSMAVPLNDVCAIGGADPIHIDAPAAVPSL